MAKYKILVVDDEESLCEILQFNLEVEGYEVDVAYSAEQALGMHPERYSLILLDVMMGEMSGFRMAQLLKSKPETAKVPVIFCTAKDTEDDTVAGLNLGADDYITKPFRLKELLVRIKSVLRRYNRTGGDATVKIKNITINTNEAKVYKNGEEIVLTAMEYRLLLILLNNRGKVLSRSQLLENIWDVEGDFVEDNTLTVYIKRLRDKIEEDAASSQIIKTVRGLGYMIDNE